MRHRRRAQRDPFETGISPTERKLYDEDIQTQGILNELTERIRTFESAMMDDDEAIWGVDEFLEELQEIIDRHRR